MRLFQQFSHDKFEEGVNLSLLPEQDRIKVVEVIDDTYRETVLHWAADKPEWLNAILSLLPEQDRIAALEVKNECGGSVLECAADTPESLNSILSLLPEQDRIAAIQIKVAKAYEDLGLLVDSPKEIVVPTYNMMRSMLSLGIKNNKTGFVEALQHLSQAFETINTHLESQEQSQAKDSNPRKSS